LYRFDFRYKCPYGTGIDVHFWTSASERLDPDVEDVLIDIAEDFIESVCFVVPLYFFHLVFFSLRMLLVGICFILQENTPVFPSFCGFFFPTQ
jgi:hypothetical protein